MAYKRALSGAQALLRLRDGHTRIGDISPPLTSRHACLRRLISYYVPDSCRAPLMPPQRQLNIKSEATTPQFTTMLPFYQ